MKGPDKVGIITFDHISQNFAKWSYVPEKTFHFDMTDTVDLGDVKTDQRG